MNNLTHHGIKGQKWYNRRYQNEDGSLTPAGKKRYAKLEAREKIKKAAAELKAKKQQQIAKRKFAISNIEVLSDDALKSHADRAKMEAEFLKNVAAIKTTGRSVPKRILEKLKTVVVDKTGKLASKIGDDITDVIYKKLKSKYDKK